MITVRTCLTPVCAVYRTARPIWEQKRFMRLAIIVAWLSFVTFAFGQTADKGRFGRALQPTDTYAAAPANRLYMGLPMTVECWAKLSSKAEFNVLVANEPKSSSTHWEIFADKGSGVFGAYMPGRKPAEIKSSRDIVDDKWHYLAMTFDGTTVR